MAMAGTPAARHDEPHGGGLAARLNWLRAAVLGANDGVVSTAAWSWAWPARRRRPLPS
jgi:hypothetical protein